LFTGTPPAALTMAAMTGTESGSEERHGIVRGIADHLRHHHDRDAELASDSEVAGYDLDTDLAHPTPHHEEVAGFDVGTDIGLDNEPPELRD
jgi:hypothetical protein